MNRLLIRMFSGFVVSVMFISSCGFNLVKWVKLLVVLLMKMGVRMG